MVEERRSWWRPRGAAVIPRTSNASHSGYNSGCRWFPKRGRRCVIASARCEILSTFVLAPKRDRLITLLGTKKGRAKVQKALAHFRDLDPRYARRLGPDHHTVASIVALLKQRGAPARCYVLSEDSELDGRELPLEEGLTNVRGKGMGAFISCIPGRLGYFEAEDEGERYILERRS